MNTAPFCEYMSFLSRDVKIHIGAWAWGYVPYTTGISYERTTFYNAIILLSASE